MYGIPDLFLLVYSGPRLSYIDPGYAGGIKRSPIFKLRTVPLYNTFYAISGIPNNMKCNYINVQAHRKYGNMGMLN